MLLIAESACVTPVIPSIALPIVSYILLELCCALISYKVKGVSIWNSEITVQRNHECVIYPSPYTYIIAHNTIYSKVYLVILCIDFRVSA